MYAIVRTGGKQYRVERGSSLLVERLTADEGAKVALEALLYVDGSNVVDGGDGLSKVKVEATVLAHERGPKLRIVKFKPKRGYRRRTGHRQELTRLEVTAIKGPAAGKPRASSTAADEPAAKPTTRRRTTAAKPATRRRASTANKQKEEDGS
jgi:large subunit ribosomal protein L21